jgi:hypothetical protein
MRLSRPIDVDEKHEITIGYSCEAVYLLSDIKLEIILVFGN